MSESIEKIHIDENRDIYFLDSSVILDKNKEYIGEYKKYLLQRLEDLSKMSYSATIFKTDICALRTKCKGIIKSGICLITSHFNTENFLIDYNKYYEKHKNDETPSDPIRGFLVYSVIELKGKIYCEIYDFCDSSSYSEKYAEILFTNFIKNFEDKGIKNFWIGILQDATFVSRIKLYILNNYFGIPVITNKTLDSKVIFERRFVSLTSNDESYFRNRDEDIKKCIELKYKLETERLCDLNIFFHKNVTDYLYSLTRQNVETSGFLTFSSVGKYSGKNCLNAEINPMFIKCGKTLSVSTCNHIASCLNIDEDDYRDMYSYDSENYVFFHVHTYRTYEVNRLRINHYSPADIGVSLYHFDENVRKHYIISLEGIYSLEPTKEYKKFITEFKNSEYDIHYKVGVSTIIHENISKLFNNFLNISEFSNEEVKLSEYFKFVNDITLNSKFFIENKIEGYEEYIKFIETLFKKEEIDFIKIFKIKFFSWDDIHEKSGFIDTLLVDKCNVIKDKDISHKISEEKIDILTQGKKLRKYLENKNFYTKKGILNAYIDNKNSIEHIVPISLMVTKNINNKDTVYDYIKLLSYKIKNKGLSDNDIIELDNIISKNIDITKGVFPSYRDLGELKNILLKYNNFVDERGNLYEEIIGLECPIDIEAYKGGTEKFIYEKEKDEKDEKTKKIPKRYTIDSTGKEEIPDYEDI